MKKRKLKNGLIYYEATAVETTALGGMGICDDCNRAAPKGYLVPVLNHYMCPECFSDWARCAKHFPEDDSYEKQTAEYYEHCIPVEAEDDATADKWINVDDQMPEVFQNVLIYLKRYKCIDCAYLDADGYWCTDEDAYFQREVDYWMPMPPPPKGDKDAKA